MKFIHLSDLHIGKRVNEFSMLLDQEYILKQILDIIDDRKPDGVIIAGDIYDKSVPSAEAVILFDEFLVKLSERELYVFVISGNHDSPERIAFGGRLMQASRIYMSPVYDGGLKPVTLEDEYGKINIWMLPFVKPAHVRRFNEDKEIASYTDAMKVVIDSLDINAEERNIMITHQFVTGAERSESEEISVGGTDNVDVSVFDAFDYTALGHIHRPQNCKSERVRYSGTPLKYSFSEAKDKKSVTVVELKDKGTLNVTTVPLKPLRNMVELKGKYEELIARDYYKGTSYQEDYVRITLTDEEDIPDAIGKLRIVYRNLMKLDYDNLRTRNTNIIDKAEDVQKKSPYEHFSEFYEKQNDQPMSDSQKEIIKNIVSEIWEAEV
ncbi:MAG: exonuclease SbcCD subunit D [Ruminococcaceae bacterium]|nr:exonuclease SbcCD subunit D [Oscillospiraceae bacterium]